MGNRVGNLYVLTTSVPTHYAPTQQQYVKYRPQIKLNFGILEWVIRLLRNFLL